MKSSVCLDTFHLSILERDLVPIKFYLYTTFVQNVILSFEEMEVNKNEPFAYFCYAIKDKVKKILRDKGYHWDNKVAIELAILIPNDVSDRVGGTVFLGYYDNKWSLGLSVWSPDYKYRGYKGSVIELL